MDANQTAVSKSPAMIPPKRMPGLFIAIEGIDGSGKSSVSEALASSLVAKGRNVVLTREPGGTAIGEQIRTIVLSENSTGMTPETETLLFAAARAQHVAEVINPSLARNDIVICDRYIDSSLAYQWGGRGLTKESILTVQALATGGLMPDLRILLDLPVKFALGRRFADSDRSNRLDNEHVQFYERVRAAYLTLAAMDAPGWMVVNAERPQKEVAVDVIRRVESAINQHFGYATMAHVDWRKPG